MAKERFNTIYKDTCMSESNFQFKGSVVTTILLEISHFDEMSLIAAIENKVEQAPNFFQMAPVIIDLSKLDQVINLDEFNRLLLHLKNLGLSPIGWRSHETNKPAWQDEASLPLLPASKTRATRLENNVNQDKANPDVVIKTVVEEKRVAQSSKIISKPIRSGQQVYAEGDLIILSSVSPGAEVLADGSIHVYGALRGRALAGVKGDSNARIFCRSMEAELVSIAGNFILSDALQKILWKESAQVLLNDENLDVVAF